MVDERNFFSRYLGVDKNKTEKEARIEAFGKRTISFNLFLVNIKSTIEEVLNNHQKCKEWPWSEYHAYKIGAHSFSISET